MFYVTDLGSNTDYFYRLTLKVCAGVVGRLRHAKHVSSHSIPHVWFFVCLLTYINVFIYCVCVCVWRGGVIELGFDGYLLRLIVANNRIFAWISSSGLGITGNTAGELAFSVNQSMKCSLKYSSCPFEARIGRRYRLEQIPGTLMRVSRKLFICFDPVCGGNVSLEPNSPPGVSSIGRLKLFCALRASWSTPGGVSLISGWRFKPNWPPGVS